MKPFTFLGQTFDSEADFQRAFPAYAWFVKLVMAGADTPLKVEAELHRRDRRKRKHGLRFGAGTYRRTRRPA